jgi:hypothetical protein
VLGFLFLLLIFFVCLFVFYCCFFLHASDVLFNWNSMRRTKSTGCTCILLNISYLRKTSQWLSNFEERAMWNTKILSQQVSSFWENSVCKVWTPRWTDHTGSIHEAWWWRVNT